VGSGTVSSIVGGRLDRRWERAVSGKGGWRNNFKGRPAELGTLVEKGGIPVYVWEDCHAGEFERVWLPKFESGEMGPSDAPVVDVVMPDGYRSNHGGSNGGWK